MTQSISLNSQNRVTIQPIIVGARGGAGQTSAQKAKLAPPHRSAELTAKPRAPTAPLMPE
jgi:hypothetical protein